VIHATRLTKRYGSILALQDLNLTVPDGAVFGLLGPNGAGKTTFLRLAVGLLFPDSGQISLGQCPPYQVGYLPERPHFPGSFRVGEYLVTAGRVGGLDRYGARQTARRALEQTGLSLLAERRIASCSKGMLQRLGVAQALLLDPPLLLLDEPLDGLDPAAQAAMRQLIQLLGQAGRTVLVCTHRLSDVTQMCTHVGILAQGRLVRTGSMAELTTPRSQVSIVSDPLPEGLTQHLSRIHPQLMISGNQVILPGDALEAKSAVLRLLLDAGLQIWRLEQQKATLEEIYLDAIRSQPPAGERLT